MKTKKYLEEVGGIKQTVKKAMYYGNLRHKCFCFFLHFLGYSNRRIQDLEIRNKVYQYVKRKYAASIDKTQYVAPFENQIPKIVWVCWLQGIEAAPDLVKVCVKSIQNNTAGFSFRLIHKDNYKNYVDIPEWIEKRWEQGKLPNAHFSDILRFELLYRYGGVWVDSTVLMTGPIPNFLLSKKLFMYTTPPDDATKRFENWFIVAEKHNRVIGATKDLLYNYLQHNNKLKDYFISFICMTIVLEEFDEDYQEVIKIPNAIPLMLSNGMLKPYDASYYQEVTRLTPIHKLTYRTTPDSKSNNLLYHKIVNPETITDDFDCEEISHGKE